MIIMKIILILRSQLTITIHLQRIITNNYDKFEQQRIANNEDLEQTKSYADNRVENQTPTSPPVPVKASVDHRYYKQTINHQQSQIQSQKPIYQHPQSSIKFEQQYHQQHKQSNRQPVYRPLLQTHPDSNYRNTKQSTYYHTTKNSPKRPYKTSVTIIPFIQYITQLPTNDYQISTDKQLLNTISQSLRHTPLNYAPDAWLPIKAYTTTDLQQREIDDHLSNDQLHVSAADHHLTTDILRSSEYTPNYTQNYRDKRSTCIEEKEKVSDQQKTMESDQNVDKNKDINDKSVTRVKKQAGFDEEPEELCQTRRLFITPKAALNDKSEWRYIVNVGERDTRLKQVIKVDVCASPNGPCSSQISLPFGYVSKCKQKYIKKKLLAIDPDGQSTSTESFFIPSCCVCEIVRMNQK